jgi:hypothetical protein
MSKYLRDRYLKNLSLNGDRLRSISGSLLDIERTTNQGLNEDDPSRVSVYYMIRFDNKGFLLTDFDEVLKYHASSKNTERLIFFLDSDTSRKSNRISGKSVEIRLDVLNVDNCIFSVQDDEAAWTEATFCRLDEELGKYGNRNHLIRTAWTQFIVQIFGVVSGFILSLWAALKISPRLSIEYSFVVTFVLAFLVFSNIWTYINQQILRFLNYLFPNVALKGSKGLHWLTKSFVSAIFVAMAFFLLNSIFGFVGNLLREILK